MGCSPCASANAPGTSLRGQHQPNSKMEASKEKIVLNVGGRRYETYSSTLKTFPGTKLCQLTEPQAQAVSDYDPNANEFFFDRSAKLFGDVLNYYRTRHLHCPAGVCRALWEEELAFWGIPEAQLAPCCWVKLSHTEGLQEDLDLRGNNDDTNEDSLTLLGQGERRDYHWWARWQPKMWALFEKPYSSAGAMCLMVVSLLFNLGILILFFMEPTTYIEFDHYNTTRDYNIFHVALKPSLQKAISLLYVELFCILWFTFEFFMRLTFCPDKKKFLTNLLNVTDFLSLFPVYTELFLTTHISEMLDILSWLGFFRVLYIVKLLKIFKLLETPLMLRVLPFTFRSILKEVFILMMIFTFEILFFGALCYHAELHRPETFFDGMISSFYWAAITLTTVGYGDTYAISPFGRVIACCAAICGMLTIIFPLPIFLIKFQGYYATAVMKEKMKSNKRSH
ncbi:potassium voltage-gated channel subfamily C member 1-like isoform X1 [Eublepharis macularius]|uniref:Potassium voltage-gated channel subfamily C member 1-like isoform X1 n=2 Tax=Eublepharis macularius TaxID=481883 RepID=A0AA97K6Z1_EUBMA|nr:potassium voltage-gated channel subfamily C member 1-like isoform X1 [Eublepharis macularius]